MNRRTFLMFYTKAATLVTLASSTFTTSLSESEVREKLASEPSIASVNVVNRSRVEPRLIRLKTYVVTRSDAAGEGQVLEWGDGRTVWVEWN